MTSLTLERVGNSLIIKPWADVLARPLTCRRRIRNPDPQARNKYIEEEEPLYTILDNSGGPAVGVTFGGAFQKVWTVLTTIGGYKDVTKYIDKGMDIPERIPEEKRMQVINRQTTLPLPNWDNIAHLPPLREGQQKTLAIIACAYRGIIVAPTGDGKTFVMTTLCVLYPDLKFLLISPGKSDTASLARRLCEATNEKCSQVGGDKPKWHDDARLAVSTVRSLPKVPTDWPDVVLFDEAHAAAAPECVPNIMSFAKAKIFGFSASPKGRADNSDIITEVIFGQPIVNIEYQTSVSRGNISNIKVYSLLTEDPYFPEFKTDIARKRHGYWRHEARNKAIVDASLKLFKEDDQVLYFVATVEHGLQIKRMLPDVPFVHAGVSKVQWEEFEKAGITGDFTYEDIADIDEPALKEAFEAGTLKRAICTTIWKQAVDFKDLFGLARLDGGSGAIGTIQISGRLSRRGHDGQMEYGILLDSYDAFGPSFERASQKRRDIYKEKGWEIIDVTV